MQLDIAQSTPTASSIAALVQARYGLGEIVESEFLRRSLNQVYRLGFASGQRVVARICAERPRGGPNVSFEAAALEHWAQIGCQVSRCVTTATGEVAIQLPPPEAHHGFRAGHILAVCTSAKIHTFSPCTSYTSR